MLSKPLALAACLGLVATGVVATPVQAKTVNACVKKKTGEVRIAKKCKKGWKKVSWNTKGDSGPQGPAGPAGAEGPLTYVKDGAGNVVGRFMGLYPMGLNIMFVLVDGGLYTYLGDGRVVPLGGGSPNFTAMDCSGQAFIPSSSPPNTQLLVGAAGGPTRIVYRKSNPALGPTSAWAVTATTQVINQAIYKRDDTGACIADGSHNGTIVMLQSVTAPLDVTGPLTVG